MLTIRVRFVKSTFQRDQRKYEACYLYEKKSTYTKPIQFFLQNNKKNIKNVISPKKDGVCMKFQ